MTDIPRRIDSKPIVSAANVGSDTKEEIQAGRDNTNNQGNEINLNNQPSAINARAMVSNSGKKKHNELIAKAKEKAKELDKKQINSSYKYFDFEDYTNKQLEILIEFMSNGIGDYYAKSVIDTCDDKGLETAYQRMNELLDKGLEGTLITDDFLITEEEKYQYAKGLIDKYGSGSSSIARDLLRLNDHQYDEAVKIIDANESEQIGLAILLVNRLSDDVLYAKVNEFNKLLDAGRSFESSFSLANLYDPYNPEKYNKALELNSNGFDVSDSVKLASIENETEKDEIIKLSQDYGINIQDSVSIYSDYQGEERDQAIALKKLGYRVVEIMQFFNDIKVQIRDNFPELDKDEMNQKVQTRLNSAVNTLTELLNDKSKYYGKTAAMTLAKLDGSELELAKKYYDLSKDANISAKYATDKTLDDEMRSKLEKLLNNGFIYAAVESVKSGEADKYLAESEEKNKQIADILSKDSDYSFEDLSARDKHFVRTYGFNNEYYTPDEYVHKYLELKNMTTPEGYHIFNTEHFQRKNSEEYSEMGATINDGSLYNNIVKTLWMNPDSAEAEYFGKFLECIKNGTISPSALRHLSTSYIKSEDGTMKKVGEFCVSNNMKDDIDLYYTVVENSKPDEVQKNLIDAYIPEYEQEQDALETRKIGDAFKLKNEDFIRIKTDDKKSELMEITKETYSKLFPLVSRFSSVQQILGDCYCIEPIMSMYCDNRFRADLIKMMSEDEDGNITVKLPKSDVAVTYKNGQLPNGQNPEVFSSGADGFKLFEHAYSIAKQEELIKQLKDKLSPEKLVEFIEFANEHQNSEDDIYIYENCGEYYWTTYSEAVDQELYKVKGKWNYSHYDSFNQYILGNGSKAAFTADMLGFENVTYSNDIASETNNKAYELTMKSYLDKYSDVPAKEIHSYDKLYADMQKDEFFDENLIQISMDQHVWGLTKEIDKDGNTGYYIYNPHDQALPVKYNDVDSVFQFLNQKADGIIAIRRK